MSFTASGELLAVSRPGYEIKLIDWTQKAPFAVLPADVPHAAARLSPDGKRLVCTGAQLTLQVWDLEAIKAQLGVIGL
jgi:hypothetical protein